MLEDYLIPLILNKEINHPDEVSEIFAPVRKNNMAKSTIEGAIWDIYAQQNNQSLAMALGGQKDKIEVGISIGIQKSIDDLVALVDEYVKEESRKVMAKDMLFATLDTTVRKITPPGRQPFLMSDTVGFISNLPHHLVKAFRSTLDEVKYADLLLHVVDYSDPEYQEQIKVTRETLKDLGADHIPCIYIFNKADKELSDLPMIINDKIEFQG